MEHVTVDRVQILLDCFHDTYDVNKDLASTLLMSTPDDRLPFKVSVLHTFTTTVKQGSK